MKCSERRQHNTTERQSNIAQRQLEKNCLVYMYLKSYMYVYSIKNEVIPLQEDILTAHCILRPSLMKSTKM